MLRLDVGVAWSVGRCETARSSGRCCFTELLKLLEQRRFPANGVGEFGFEQLEAEVLVTRGL